MSDANPPDPGRQNLVPMLQRIGEVVKTIFRLAESVEELKAKNDQLAERVDELRRDVDQQAVRGVLDDRVERRAEATARRVRSEYGANKPSSQRDT